MPWPKLLLIAGIAFLTSSALLFAPIPFDLTDRQEKKQYSDQQLAELEQTIFTPKDVTLLERARGFRQPNYQFECYGSHLNLIYGTNRALTELMSDYERGLIENGWKISSGHMPSETFKVFTRNPQSELFIETGESVTNPSSQHFELIYRILVYYLTPHTNCTG
jgi:hypothetical protein